MREICQRSLPFAPWMQPASRRLPGVQPVQMADWLQVDDAYAAQMARRLELLETERENVLAVQPGAEGACAELQQLVLGQLSPLGFTGNGEVTCPDGRSVRIDPANPLPTLCHLVQEDFCILQPIDGQHVLTAALLCFPASWSLHEKLGCPLMAIHDPVPEYDAGINKRVERLFTAARAGRPMMRANALIYADPNLYHPHRHSDPARQKGERGYLRSERQTILRLPESGAVIFSIHTYVLREADLTPEQAAGLKAHPIAGPYGAER